MRYSLLIIKEPTKHFLRSRHILILQRQPLYRKRTTKNNYLLITFCDPDSLRPSRLASFFAFFSSAFPGFAFAWERGDGGQRDEIIVREDKKSNPKERERERERSFGRWEDEKKKTCKNQFKKDFSAPCSLASAFSSPRPWAYLSYPVLYRRPFCFEMF